MAAVLGQGPFRTVHRPTVRRAIEWAADTRPDIVVLDADLPDGAGIDTCRMLQRGGRLPRSIPMLVMTAGAPTPHQMVAGVRAGVWDYLVPPLSRAEVVLKLETFLQAKQDMTVAHDECLALRGSDFATAPPLARHARALGSAMAQRHGALACVVFALRPDAPDEMAGRLLARVTRVSDVVGALSPTELAILAPATDDAGAMRLAQRVATSLRDSRATRTPLAPGESLWAGYDAVANLTYMPMDPALLLSRAAAAVRVGRQEPTAPWMRRFDLGTPPDGEELHR